jgi:hypothetical protein
VRHHCAGFPLTVAIICEPRAGALSLQAAQALRHLLKELRERSPSSLLVVCHPSNVRAEQICEAAREAGVACKAAGLPPKLTTHDTTRHALEAADLDLIETTDLVVLISGANSTAANFENRILATLPVSIDQSFEWMASKERSEMRYRN